MLKTYITHKGGLVTYTPTGLIHRAARGAYSGYLAEAKDQIQAADEDRLKRGRGRPPKQKQF